MDQLQLNLTDLGLSVRLKGMGSGSVTTTSNELGLVFRDIVLVTLASPVQAVWRSRHLIRHTLAEAWQRRGLPAADYLTDAPMTPQEFQALCRAEFEKTAPVAPPGAPPEVPPAPPAPGG